MTLSIAQRETLDGLLLALHDDQLVQEQVFELEQLVLSDADAMHHYLRVVNLRVGLRWMMGDGHGGHKTPSCDSPIEHSLAGDNVCSRPIPIHAFLGAPLHGALGYFSSGWPVAYLAATVILAIGLLIGSITHVSQPVLIVEQSPMASKEQEEQLESELPTEPVGRITGMVNCKWADPSSRALSGDHVPLGRKYAIRSGLLEITYETGAKVILQGPVTYEVESADGGYLSLGKLTAKLEKPSAVSDQGSENANCKLQIANYKLPDIHQSSFITHHSSSNPQSLIPNPSPLFTIKTPTATVTDLGTEFGVEVDKHGTTTSHVFRGSVRLQVASADGGAEGDAQILHENASARVERGDANRITVLGPSAKPTNFVRQLPKRTIKTLDLVDVMARGDGLSDPCNRWIDPTTGRVTDTQPKLAGSLEDYLIGDGKYHRAGSASSIDGVFIPDGRRGPVQVDSAGHVFAEFPSTANHTSDQIRTHTKASADKLFASQSKLRGFDYAMPGHSLLYMQANVAITIDLDVVRRANAGYKLLRFRAMAGKCEPRPEDDDIGLADFWVLVDGQKRFGRREISSHNGDFSVVIPIGEKDRFLTLASTDSGNGIVGDWIMFGDPRLDLAPTDPPDDSASRK